MIHGITSYGLEYYLISRDEWFNILKPASIDAWTDYDRNIVDMQIINCGYGILDTIYQMPIDNEYDLEEIYNQVEAITR